MKTKAFYESKTFWVNVLGLIVVVLEYIGTINIVSPEIVASILAVLNLVLRLGVTQNTRLTLK